MNVVQKKIISRNNNCLCTSNHEGTIILNLDTGNYLRLNETGKVVWEILDTEKEYNDLVNILKEEFSAEGAIIENDIDDFLTECEEKKILIFHAN